MANIGLQSSWEQVSDEMLCEILKYLPTSDLLMASKVCRRWERVAGDRYLWNQVDLTLFNTPLQQLTTFTKNYISYTLQSLQLKGYQTAEGDYKSGPSAVFFADLQQRCPNLRRLHLSNVDLRAPLPASVEFLALSESWLSRSGWPTSRFDAESQTVTLPRLREVELVGVKLHTGAMAALPASVERLRILNTRLPDSCFQSTQSLNQADPMNQGVVSPSRLAELDFSGSDNTALEVCDATTAWPHVTTLKLNDLTFNTHLDYTNFPPNTPVGQIVKNTDRLEVLEANGALCSDFDFDHICHYLGGTLRRLSIARCFLTNHAVTSIASAFTNLESLDISGCPGHVLQSHMSYFMFGNLRPTLSFLNLSDMNVDSGIIDRLRLCMPECEIVH